MLLREVPLRSQQGIAVSMRRTSSARLPVPGKVEVLFPVLLAGGGGAAAAVVLLVVVRVVLVVDESE
jgi:hypothetical protein